MSSYKYRYMWRLEMVCCIRSVSSSFFFIKFMLLYYGRNLSFPVLFFYDILYPFMYFGNSHHEIYCLYTWNLIRKRKHRIKYFLIVISGFYSPYFSLFYCMLLTYKIMSFTTFYDVGTIKFIIKTNNFNLNHV